MNFLAHFYLSFDNPDLLAGNFIGEFVSAKQASQFESEIQRGILLHRFIDEQTDSDQSFKNCKLKLFPRYRHYSNVIIDMFIDHYLASNWDSFHKNDLRAFTDTSYTQLEMFRSIFPQQGQQVFDAMRKYDWLPQYAEVKGIREALTNMDRRSSFQSQMGSAHEELLIYYDFFQAQLLDLVERLELKVKDKFF